MAPAEIDAETSPEPPSSGHRGGAGAGSGGARVDRLRDVGEDLAASVRGILAALPGAPLRPNALVALLGVNRAVASRTLGATAKSDPLEVMHLIPGPEPLRKLARAAGAQGVSASLVAAAERAIDAFDGLIRHDAGTRAALDAMLSASLPGARERFELASRYSVHKGMSQLKGAQAELWLGVAVVAPSADDPDKHDLTWLNGAVAMQRLRPGATIRFSYRHRDNAPQAPTPPAPGIMSLDQFCVNPPARLDAREAGNVIHYALPDDMLGPREVVDMFVVDHHEAAMRRYATDQPRRRNSLFAEPAIPVGTLVFDAVLHDDVFPGSDPRLFVYDTSYDGIANVNDAERDLDRVDVHEAVEFLGHDLSRFRLAELPAYHGMLAHLAEHFGWDPARFRGYRVRMRYPVYGWQVCLSFQPPEA